MRAAVYARVSTEEQARTGFSLADQLEKCRAKAAERGATVLLEAVDPGYSGETLDRPGLAEVRAAARTGMIDALIVYDPDRLSRKLAHQLLLTDELEKAGVSLEFVNFEWRNTPEGRLFYSLRGAVAEFEKEKIRERTINGRLQGARQGRFTAKPGWYGYHYDKVTKELTIDEEEAGTVREIFALVVERRMSAASVARELAERGARPPRGKLWYTAAVLRILRNEVYAGVAYNNRIFRPKGGTAAVRPKKEWIPVPVPAIVERGIWEKAQRIIDGHRTIRRPTGTRPEFLLRGLIRSGECGGRYTPKVTVCNKTGRRYGYYVCTKALRYRFGPGAEPCRCRQIAAAKLDALVWEKVLWVLNNPAEVLAEAGSDQAEVLAREIGRVAEEMSFLERKRERTIEAFTLGWRTKDETERSLADTAKRLDYLRNRKIALEEALGWSSAALTMEEVVAFCRTMVERLDAADFRSKRAIVEALVEEVVIDRDEVRILGRFDSGALGGRDGSFEWAAAAPVR